MLDQKRVRIGGHLESQRKEIRELENAMKHLRFDMDRMNGALAKNGKRIEALTNSNQMLETEFVQKLKEIERASLEMEDGVKRVRSEKEEMSAESSRPSGRSCSGRGRFMPWAWSTTIASASAGARTRRSGSNSPR